MFKKNNNINTNAEHKKNRKINYFKIVWVTGILAILIYILLIVIRYKVYYEYTVGKIYFYNCKVCKLIRFYNVYNFTII